MDSIARISEFSLTRDVARLLVRESRRGKSIGRTLLNYCVSQQAISGRVLDLGSKSDGMSYNRFLKKSGPCEITYTDIDDKAENVITLDLEEDFPLPDASYDYVLCFNVLEHIFNFQECVNEVFRVLDNRGVFIGFIPFLVGCHQDPHDYFRYTHEAIATFLTRAGFRNINVTPLGTGPILAALSVVMPLVPVLLRAPLIRASLGMDCLVVRSRPKWKTKCPVGYFFVARKDTL